MSDDLDDWLQETSPEGPRPAAAESSKGVAEDVEEVERARPWVNRTLTPRTGRMPLRPRRPKPPSLTYPNCAEWVEKWLAPTFRRQVGQQARYRWNPRWWESEEALSRLDSLWRAWEKLRLEAGTGMAVWWRDYCDPCMGVLMSADGPWASSEATNGPGEPLPCDPAPRVMFPDVENYLVR